MPSSTERKKKLLTDVNYRYRDLQNTKKRLKKNVACETNKRRARDRNQKIRQQKQQKDYHRAVVHVGRHDQTNDLSAHIRRQMRKQRVKKRLSGCLHSVVNSLTTQQRYWVRRSRLLALARQRQTTRHLQEQMQAQSGSSMLDIQLLFNKADKQLKQSGLKVQALHKNLARQAVDFLQYLPDEQITEDHLLTAFEGIRIHSSASETYFLEHSYHTLPSTYTVPVDEYGKARIFDIVDPMAVTAW